MSAERLATRIMASRSSSLYPHAWTDRVPGPPQKNPRLSPSLRNKPSSSSSQRGRLHPGSFAARGNPLANGCTCRGETTDIMRARLDRQYRDAVMQSAGLLVQTGPGLLRLEMGELVGALIGRVAISRHHPDRLEITLDRDALTLRSGSPSQTVALPAAVQGPSTLAQCRDSVLILSVRKVVQPRLGTASDTPQCNRRCRFQPATLPSGRS